jgi:predicted PurR-regulated permease PerM/methylmalonyl-CoA mutase cobalamin-binding subunit
MSSEREPSTLRDPFKLTLVIFGVIAFMYFTAEVLKPLALAVLLSFALAPLARFLERRGLPRGAAVIATVVATMALLGGVGLVVGNQLTGLANQLPGYQKNIEAKLSKVIRRDHQSATERLQELANQVTAKLDKPQVPVAVPAPSPGEVAEAAEVVRKIEAPAPIQKVEVVQIPSFQERLRTAIGPYLEYLGIGSFVLILVLFMLMGREDLSDRIIGLFGHRQISLTTRTTEEIGQRISRYLATFALVNSGYGLVVGVGLAVIGVPYAVLWGCLAAGMRFIPYVGPGVAFLLPLVFSFAYFPGWAQPLEVFALFAVIEVLLNSFLEPVIYGKTTGVSALGLLVAAMFWTWLWGTLGLLLSTPLTVCLAVLGKYVPGLGFFATLLGEEADLDPDVRFYQRLVALDREGALAVTEDALKRWPRAEVYDRILIPTLSRAERDAGRDELGEQEQAFVWQVIGEVVDAQEGVPELSLQALAPAADQEKASGGVAPDPEAAPIELIGVTAVDTSDALVLKMLAQLLAPSGCRMEIIDDVESPLQVAERVAEHEPRLVVLSHVPPEGMTQARYLVRRLRARCPELPIVVGRWGETGAAASVAERLVNVGATTVVFSLADARERVLAKLAPTPDLVAPRPEPAAVGQGS